MENTAVWVAAITAISGILTLLIKNQFDLKKERALRAKTAKETDKKIEEVSTNAASCDPNACRQVHAKLSEFVEIQQTVAQMQVRAAKKSMRQRLVSTDNDKPIYSALQELRATLDCARVYVLQVHPRLSPMFASVVYEALDKGVQSIMPSLSNIELRDYPELFRHAAATPFLEQTKVCAESIKDSNHLGYLLNNGVVATFGVKMVDKNGDWVGELVVEYMQEREEYDVDAIRTEMSLTAITLCNLIPDIV